MYFLKLMLSRAVILVPFVSTLSSARSSTSNANGLTTAAASVTASVGTVLISGTLSTYRVIETLAASIDETPPVLPNIYDPQAINAQGVCPGYIASNLVNTAHGFTADLSLAGKACNVYGTDIENLHLRVQYQNAERLNVRIVPKYTDATNVSQYIVADRYLHEPKLGPHANRTSQINDLQFTWTNEPSFGFAVIRRSTGDILFDTRDSKLVFENQFIEFGTAMPSNYNLYGLGETIHGLRLGNNFTKTIFAADAGDPIDGNIYGSHPFYLDTRYYETDSNGNMILVTTADYNTGKSYVSVSHGVFLRNIHGQEILLRPSNITWRAIGGSIDLFFLSGPTQPQVTRQYTSGVVGLPAEQKYSVLGYHQCRWGYTNWTEMQDVVDNFRKFDIPLEYIWNDIDLFYAYRNFENDPTRFSYEEGATFLSQLHAAGQHYVPIIDAAIYRPNLENASDVYQTYTLGSQSGVFLKNPDGSEFIGAVWPGFTVFPDWRANSTQAWWTRELSKWHEKFPFDGAWTDMNEASSFCVGSCGTNRTTENPVHPPFGLPGEVGNVIYDYPEAFNITNATEAAAASSSSAAQASRASKTAAPVPTTTTSYIRTKPTPGQRSLEYPPYALNNINGALPVHAVAPNATHADGSLEYDIHNVFGHEETLATYNALLEIFPNKRPFIITRSQFAGSGTRAGHWGGDNASKWYYMYFSIPQALSMSLFGIPLFGVDTCGFSGNTDEELCARWMQLSAFFTFYRNHNILSAIPQEPYRWSSVIAASKTAMAIRYSLLPYIYTLMHLAHTTGDTVMRALAWEFPNDPSLASADRQFLLGPSLMLIPVLAPLATTVNGVFPGIKDGAVWYDWYSQTAVSVKEGENKTISAPLGHIPVYVLGGKILPMQLPGYTTAESRRNPWSLLVALSLEGTATGQLYLDDGESVVPNATRFVDITATGKSLYASGQGTFEDSNKLANITILGLGNAPRDVAFNGSPSGVSVTYNATSRAAIISGLQNAMGGGAWNADWALTWT